MADGHFMHGRISAFAAMVVSVLALLAIHPLQAQPRTPEQADRAITDLQAQVALQNNGALAGVNSQLESLKKQVEEVQRAVDQRQPAAPAPLAAWVAFGF